MNFSNIHICYSLFLRSGNKYEIKPRDKIDYYLTVNNEDPAVMFLYATLNHFGSYDDINYEEALKYYKLAILIRII